MRAFLSTWVVVAATLVGCKKSETPPPTPSAANEAPSQALAPTEVAPPAQQVSPTTESQDPPQLCEVEMFGTFSMEGQLAEGQQRVIYVSDGDCMADGRSLTRSQSGSAETFFAEVFVPCGKKLTLCGSVEAMGDLPSETTRYGKVDREMLAVGEGEIMFQELKLTLATGPARTFAPMTDP